MESEKCIKNTVLISVDAVETFHQKRDTKANLLSLQIQALTWDKARHLFLNHRRQIDRRAGTYWHS